MRHAPARFLVWLSMSWAACFSVDPSRVVYKCDEAHPCPSGLVCQGQICGPGSGDGGGLADLATDGGLSPSDGGQGGCARGNGTRIGTVWACPGAFVVGEAAARCASGYSLCRQISSAVQSDSGCRLISGFYAADVPGYYTSNPGNGLCGTPATLYFGCGAIKLNRVWQTMGACGGASRAVDCAAAGWTCGATLQATAQVNEGDGVLCCPQ